MTIVFEFLLLFNFDYFNAQEVDENDEQAMANFMSEKPQDRRTLADIIMERINEKKTELQSQMSGIFLFLFLFFFLFIYQLSFCRRLWHLNL